MTVATATVKGGLWDANSATPLSSISGHNVARRRIARSLGTRAEMTTRALATALDGVVAGSNATKTITRVEPNAELGGKRVIETQTLINRNTVAGDVTELNNYLYAYSTKTTFGASPPANKDGNPLGTR